MLNEEQFGVKHAIGASVAGTRLAEQALVAAPPQSAKFTMDEWRLNNSQRSRTTEDQQQLADRVIADVDRVVEATVDRAKLGKETTDQRMKQRIDDIEFNANELNLIRKEICLELEALGMYKMRLEDCLAALQQNALNICKKCLILRDGRIGIDLVVDEVEHALHNEINTIVGGQSLLRRALEQLCEQMRRLRATRYGLDRDLHNKTDAADTDRTALRLKPTDLSLSIYEGFTDLDPANISVDEWNRYSANLIRLAAKEVTSARPIRVYIDTLMKQAISDMWGAYEKCNTAFLERINDTRIAKARLEDMHLETTKKISELQKRLLVLEKALADKQQYIALAHTRLGKRAQRRDAELVSDSAGRSMMLESEMLRYSVEQLQFMMHEATATLRFLLQTQIQLEEDINVKMNTLKIDQVDCMSIRASMDFHSY